jgi:CubicO group peptidase (beta-lactamase class C family)
MMSGTHVASIMAAGIAERVFPGAVHAVGMPDGSVRQRGFGFHRYDQPSPAVTIDTCYDWASLTKIVCATAALRLIGTGQIGLNDEIARYLPGVAPVVTLRHLLTHTSGLDIRLSTAAKNGALGLWDAVYAVQPSAVPGTRVAYANVNSLLLGRVLEQVTGMGLAALLDALVLAPAGMTRTGFNPLPQRWADIPPTEQDAPRGLVQGSVHDESAAALGGIAGHAGLFGPAIDLVRFGQGWLQTLADDSPWQIPAGLAQLAVTNQSPIGQLGCGLGWMLERESFMGQAMHVTAAHTGFTGPIVAIVPERGYTWALLSNRTWPVRTTARHHALSARVSDALWQTDDADDGVRDE